MAEDLSTIQAEKIVDARGTSCPGPILAAKKGIPDVSVGGIMEVLATDRGTHEGPAGLGQEDGSRVSWAWWRTPATCKLYVKKMK